MSLTTSIHDADGYLLVRMQGEWRADDVRPVIHEMRKQAEERGTRRILADTRMAAPPPTELDRFFVGRDAAEFLGGLKVAVVYKAELINRFMENTAVNRGAHLRVFSDMDEAEAWLMSSS